MSDCIGKHDFLLFVAALTAKKRVCSGAIDLLSYKDNLRAYMHAHTNDVVISQSNSIANNKSLPSII